MIAAGPVRLALLPVAALLLISASAFSVRPDPGPLVIIGGGERPGYLMERIVELAGGDDCRMVVLPMASSSPVDTGRSHSRQLSDAGCPDVSFVPFDSMTADHDSIVSALDGATGIFFSGGSQSRLAGHMRGTRLLDRVREIHREGGVLAGTSAGAAVMSEIMITGAEALRPDADRSFATIEEGNIVTAEGFGFVTRAIIDQHFIARKRENRLIALVLENPGLVGVGIDESTAIIVDAADTFEVVGEGTVMVVDATGATAVGPDDDGDLGGHGLALHLLRSGERYDLVRRLVLGE